MEENEILRVQATLCQCHLLRSDFSIPERIEAVPSYGSGKADIILTGGGWGWGGIKGCLAHNVIPAILF